MTKVLSWKPLCWRLQWQLPSPCMRYKPKETSALGVPGKYIKNTLLKEGLLCWTMYDRFSKWAEIIKLLLPAWDSWMDLGSQREARGPSTSTQTCFGKSTQSTSNSQSESAWRTISSVFSTRTRIAIDYIIPQVSEWAWRGFDNFHIWHVASFIRPDFDKSLICSLHEVSVESWWTLDLRLCVRCEVISMD